MQIIDQIIKIVSVFILAIFTYIVLTSLLISGLSSNSLLIIKDFIVNLFTLRIFDEERFIGIIILLVGMPAIIINYLSKIISIKLNFFILPIISILLLFIFSIIYLIFFKFEESMDFGLGMILYLGTALIFQIFFSLTISFLRLFKKR